MQKLVVLLAEYWSVIVYRDNEQHGVFRYLLTIKEYIKMYIEIYVQKCTIVAEQVPESMCDSISRSFLLQ